MENNEELVYYLPGDLVTLKKDIPNKPIMLVVKKETSLFKHDAKDKKSVLVGIRCRWFTTDLQLLEAVFSTKDLQLI